MTELTAPEPQGRPRLLAQARLALRLLGSPSSARWGGVVVLSAVSGAMEAVGALLVFVLLQAMTGAEPIRRSPLGKVLARIDPTASSHDLLLWSAAVVAVFFAVRSVVLLFQTYVVNRVSVQAGVELGRRVLDGYLGASYEFHLARQSAQLIRNAQESTAVVAANVFLGFVTIASESVLVAGVLVALFLSTPIGALVGAGLAGLLSVVTVRWLRPQFSRVGRRHQQFLRGSLHVAQQTLQGFRDVRLTRSERHFVDEFVRERSELARAQYTYSTLTAVPRIFFETVLVLVLVALLMISTASGSPQDALASVGVLAYAALRILPSSTKILTQINNIEFGRAALLDIEADLKAVEVDRPVDLEPDAQARVPLTGSLSLHDVHYRYPTGDSDALDGITLSIRAGETIGVVGRTGSGKSTLVDVLVALLPPTAGTVQVDGVDVRGREAGWQQSVGVVSQTFYIFDDTLRRNIAFGIEDDEIDDALVEQAIQQAQLGDVVAALPDGVQTMLGERGIRFSGGQRQRVAIARALYRQPDLLVFDEGTSALDTETERQLIAAMSALRGRFTIVMVAHRLTTVAGCDRIFLLDAGRVVDEGDYGTLLDRNPVFHRLAT